MSEDGEVETWRTSVLIMCFMFVQYHPADRVKRQAPRKADIRRREPRMGRGGQQRSLGGEDTDDEAKFCRQEGLKW
ncbi:hypothetical protein PIB30_032340 [Stylosanthes scabra]|uniref:Uncharacterized protein n=1 Tax=Stylosanthes scabra TaxID=79078 RepID=A0ABU6SBZ6_9FABA|nr:hypothetical protein [Stylosanthes scabra]